MEEPVSRGGAKRVINFKSSEKRDDSAHFPKDVPNSFYFITSAHLCQQNGERVAMPVLQIRNEQRTLRGKLSEAFCFFSEIRTKTYSPSVSRAFLASSIIFCCTAAGASA